ncbi:MAG: proton-conducting transporter membrane subunit [Acinetobacter sp.]
MIAAAFYLFCGWITAQRGTFKDHLKVAPKIKNEKAAALTYFLIAMMMAGLPPFSGFLGKVFILQATAETAYQAGLLLLS